MKIYTKTGDDGETGLFGGARVSKASAQVDAYGHVDELNSVIGLAQSHKTDPEVRRWINAIQAQLFQVGAELATAPDKMDKLTLPLVQEADIEAFESAIDKFESELEPLKTFILPGGTQSASALHLARCVCRRAERAVVSLAADQPVRPTLIQYLNRLSDFLFVMARAANASQQTEDVPWVGQSTAKGDEK